MRKRVSAGSVLGIPYLLFQILFIVVPLLVIVYYAFTDGQGQFSAENFLHFFTNGKAVGTLVYSFAIAAVSTAVCLLIAYPTALALARGGYRKSRVLLMLFVMPMWINFCPAAYGAEGNPYGAGGKSGLLSFPEYHHRA